MVTLRNLIKSPLNYYIIPAVVAPLTVAISVIITVYNQSLRVNFVPLYSTIISYRPQSYVFGVSSIIAAVCICAATYHTFNYLNSKNRVTLQKFTTKVIVYAVGTSGLATAVLLLAVAMYSLADGFWNHCLLELAMYTFMFIFYFLADYLFHLMGRRLSQKVMIYDIALIALYLIYFAFGYYVIHKRHNTLFSIVSTLGYVLYIAAFTRLSVQKGQLLAFKRK